MILTGTNPDSVTQTVAFTLTIVRDCSAKTASPPGNFARAYTINDGDRWKNFKRFTSDDTFC